MRCVLQISYRLARLTFLLRLLFLPQFGAFHAFATLQTAPVSIPNIFFALFTSCFITFCLLNPSLIYLITRLLIILVLLITMSNKGFGYEFFILCFNVSILLSYSPALFEMICNAFISFLLLRACLTPSLFYPILAFLG